jgi:hypothetical protein
MRIERYWWDQASAPPQFDNEVPAKTPPEQITLFERELNNVQPSPFAYKSPFELLDRRARPPWWYPGDGQQAYGNAWPKFERFDQPLSDGERQVLAKRIAALSLQAKSTADASKDSGAELDDVAWNEGNHLHLVIAGPAVKDGVATYRSAQGDTRVRIPLDGASGMPELLYQWAGQRGFPMRVSLGPKPGGSMPDAEPLLNSSHSTFGQSITGDAPRTVEAETGLPAWIVNPDGVFRARLVALSTVGANNSSGACLGSDWVELELKGDAQPPIWAVLVSARPSLSTGATVKRLPPATGEAPYREGKRSEVELRWANAKIPALRLVARRFDYVESTYKITAAGRYEQTGERTLGNAWGVQVFNADQPTPDPNEGGVRAVAASGSPQCAPP